MNKLFKTLSFIAVIALLAVAYSTLSAQAAPSAASYQDVLGKSINDRTVEDFIAANDCAPTGQFRMCPSVGVALWADANETVKTVYLYVNGADGFSRYTAELPFGLASNDTMADVEEKFGQPLVVHAPQAGWTPGLPDTASSPDRIHSWAVYERFGVTVIYNSASASDRNATIYAILINE